MKSKSFSKAKRYTCSGSIRWAKQIRSRIERRYTRNKLHDIIVFVDKVEDFDILPLPQTKPGYWAWVIS